MVIGDENFESESVKKVGSVSVSLPLASPMDRLAASVIDHAIVLPPVLALATAPLEARLKEAFLIGQDYKAAILFFLAALLGLFLVFFYHLVCNLHLGATLGQRLLRLRAVDYNTQSGLDFYSAFLRSSSFVLNLLTFGVGSLAVYSHRNRRTFYDRISETVVLTGRDKSVGQPSTHEILVTRGLFGSMGLMAFAILMGGFFLALSSPLDREALLQSLESDGELCAKVTDSASQWPEEDGEVASRVSVAIALLLAGEVDVSCLKAELNPRILLLNEDKLYYLAKSMIHADNTDLAGSYLDASCESDPDSTHCQMATAMQMIIEEDWSGLPELNRTLAEDAPVFFKIWLADRLIELEKFERAQEIVSDLPDVETLAAERALLQMRIFAGRNQIPEAKGAFQVAKPLLADHENGELLGRICQTQLESGCDAAFEDNCAVFSDWVAGVEEPLNFRTSLAYAEVARCSKTAESLPNSSLFTLLDKDVRDFVRAFLKESNSALTSLTENNELPTDVRLAAMAELVKRDPSPQNILRAELMSAKSQPGSERLAAVLLSHWSQHRQFEKIVEFLAGKRQTWGDLSLSELKQLVVSEYHLGRTGVARKHLALIYEKEPSSIVQQESSLRSPASYENPERFTDEFNLIARDLQ